jgi:OOP family OmpA-OmpF porin
MTTPSNSFQKQTPARLRRTLGALLGVVIAGAASFGAGAARAGTEVGSMYVAPQVLGLWLDKDRKADDGAGFAFSVGKAVAEKWNVEGSLFGSNHDLAGGNKLELKGFDFAAQRLYYRDASVNPYIFAGIGWLESRVPNAKDAHFFLKYGVGVVADIAKNTQKGTNLQLRGEIGARRTDDNANRPVDYVAGLGLQYSWGAPPPVMIARDLPPEPAAAPVDGDDDNDGVPNSRDKCPATPAGAKVDADGCELDSDGDGVVDSKDQCPGTPPGAKVDARGCECGDIILRGVTFETGSAELTAQGRLTLDSIAKGLLLRKGAQIEVRGHTDDVGSEIANLALSRRRADSVKAYLVSRGMSADDLSTQGLGEMEHVAPNDTPEDREQNRRVTMQIRSVICEERAPEELTLRGVTFATGSAALTPTSRQLIDAAVAYLKVRPDAQVEVRGHTDSTGNEAANVKLSQARAEAVRAALIKGGLDAGHLVANGLGSSVPVADNAKAEGRAENRRVTLRIKN